MNPIYPLDIYGDVRKSPWVNFKTFTTGNYDALHPMKWSPILDTSSSAHVKHRDFFCLQVLPWLYPKSTR